MFKSGFVNIIGKPNVGKSTLMNVLVGEKLSIVTPKAQTTRKRILGIVTEENYQIVFSDTPGIIDEPEYKLHEWMNEQINSALSDADVILFMTTPYDKINTEHEIISKLAKINIPLIPVINKTDIISEKELKELKEKWENIFKGKEIICISALHKLNTEKLFEKIITYLPEHPPYFDKDELTDQTERFIASEIIREKIFLNYKQEIPYSVQVIVEEYKDKGEIIVIKAVIYVEKDSHKNIIIGKGGSAIKAIGIDARKDIEQFAGKKIFLELFVKIKERWKNDERSLKYFGYN